MRRALVLVALAFAALPAAAQGLFDDNVFKPEYVEVSAGRVVAVLDLVRLADPAFPGPRLDVP